MNREYILISGGGDLASGVAWVLQRQGFGVAITEKQNPTCVRRKASFAEAVYSKEITIEGLTGRLASDFSEALALIAQGIVPVLIDPQGQVLREHPPLIFIDARMTKGVKDPTLSNLSRPPRPGLIIALGPGFTAGVQADIVIETHREAELGRAIYAGSAMADTGIPGKVLGFGAERVLRAPAEGVFREERQIGERVAAGETVAYVGDVPVVSKLSGTLRGLLKGGLKVYTGMKVGDIHPAVDPEVVNRITDKSRLIGKSVAKAIQTWQQTGKVVTPGENCTS